VLVHRKRDLTGSRAALGTFRIPAQRSDSLNHLESAISSRFFSELGEEFPTSRSAVSAVLPARTQPNTVILSDRRSITKNSSTPGVADFQTDLARLCSTPRSTISAYLRLLGLDEEVRAEALGVADDDERISTLTEARLRHLLGLEEPTEQRRRFRALLAGKPGGIAT
jgi:hypothetical protein